MKIVPRDGENALTDDDYCATEGALWVRVGNVAIRIFGNDNGVSITACLDMDEDESTLDSMFVPFPNTD